MYYSLSFLMIFFNDIIKLFISYELGILLFKFFIFSVEYLVL